MAGLSSGRMSGVYFTFFEKVTRLGNRHRSEAVIRAEDPRGRPVYWVGPAGAGQDNGPGTDFHAISEGYVSVTPLTVDLTNHAALDSLRSWVGTT